MGNVDIMAWYYVHGAFYAKLLLPIGITSHCRRFGCLEGAGVGGVPGLIDSNALLRLAH